ncbi:hypothetical protein PV341_30370 [Streptomyces sp. PA03-1a]|nr:hypothetical protein [Streptomyces sp. PA03-1a]MDX2818298.1 hypothetical protein [Streptomyces sp. PA03-5A]
MPAVALDTATVVALLFTRRAASQAKAAVMALQMAAAVLRPAFQ